MSESMKTSRAFRIWKLGFKMGALTVETGSVMTHVLAAIAGGIGAGTLILSVSLVRLWS